MMGWILVRHPTPTTPSGADRQSTFDVMPPVLNFVWGALIVLIVLEAVNELWNVDGPSILYRSWVHDLLLGAAAALVLIRAASTPEARRAWVAIGLAIALWCIGDVSWTLAYGGHARTPYPTFADALWLLWYPLMVLGMATLIRMRVHRFELHRWMDGLVAILVVLGFGIALVVEPAVDHGTQGALATVVNWGYPVLDVLLVGTILGVYGLLGWRPDQMWVLLGLGVVAITVGDAVHAVQSAGGVPEDAHYDFVWTLGALLVAFAACVRAPVSPRDLHQVTGLRAVALPLVAQALAAGIQLYAFFGEIGRSERIVTVVILLMSSVQVYLTRPRPSADVEHHNAAAFAGTPEAERGTAGGAGGLAVKGAEVGDATSTKQRPK